MKSTGAAAIAAAPLSATLRAATNKNSRLRIFQIGTGGIGGKQRNGLKGHPMVEFAGFCDIDQSMFKRIEKDHSAAWRISDYREAFANRVDQFYAVIVDTPDFITVP